MVEDNDLDLELTELRLSLAVVRQAILAIAEELKMGDDVHAEIVNGKYEQVIQAAKRIQEELSDFIKNSGSMN